MNTQRLLIILGDQLDFQSSILKDGDKKYDRVVMIECHNESSKVLSHKARTALFLSAMRHFCKWLRSKKWKVDYIEIGSPHSKSFYSALEHLINENQPEGIAVVQPGEYSVLSEIKRVCKEKNLSLQILEDSHFLCGIEEFKSWRNGRKKLVMEHFYRYQRKKLNILMNGKDPIGDVWNFDKDNRKTFGKKGPGFVPLIARFKPNKLTKEVFHDVEKYFSKNPGQLEKFNWPVTREQALKLLKDFITHRLPSFGPFQDAMWTDQSLLYHSGISAALNLKLLNPREVIDSAVKAYEEGNASIASVEGFIRQLIGWREFMRGIYWTEMPDLISSNSLNAKNQLPAFYWTAKTDMSCLNQVINQILETGYSHHIQRLMVTGLFALLLGVKAEEVHKWFLAIHVDAIEWVEAPNTLGMSQFADGGVVASKPYVASGKYINRMSNYCDKCRYDPDQSVGDTACPFTTLYWDFLIRHDGKFKNHPRAAMQWRSLTRLDSGKRKAISQTAKKLKSSFSY